MSTPAQKRAKLSTSTTESVPSQPSTVKPKPKRSPKPKSTPKPKTTSKLKTTSTPKSKPNGQQLAREKKFLPKAKPSETKSKSFSDDTGFSKQALRSFLKPDRKKPPDSLRGNKQPLFKGKPVASAKPTLKKSQTNPATKSTFTRKALVKPPTQNHPTAGFGVKPLSEILGNGQSCDNQQHNGNVQTMTSTKRSAVQPTTKKNSTIPQSESAAEPEPEPEIQSELEITQIESEIGGVPIEPTQPESELQITQIESEIGAEQVEPILTESESILEEVATLVGEQVDNLVSTEFNDLAEFGIDLDAELDGVDVDVDADEDFLADPELAKILAS